ncbi:MAG: hypothetical protein QW812_06420, partial [Thermoplasmataceae archaeon]
MIKKIAVLLVVVVSVLFSLFVFPGGSGGSNSLAMEERYSPAASTTGTFAFVSEFTSGGTPASYGWETLSGNPSIQSSVNYYGEPSLQLMQGTSLFSDRNITPGDQLVSFQVAINSAGGNGSISIVNSQNQSVACIAINGSLVYAGTSQHSLKEVGSIPTTSAYPAGWAYISANLLNASTHKTEKWELQLFVDQTDSVFANITVPGGYSYSGIILSSSFGTVYMTDIIFTSYEIPIYLPGYNNMEGYGQGSGLIVSLLKPFTILHANMILGNWTALQQGILSFQINAMNYYGATRSTCVGFFQLGIDLDPNGTISPWYVAGTNCFAHYFLPS